ncbi:MAG TPA: hypothetical protein VGO47_09620 [Chlamydiales bacterium]|nr:hypothetical protein [Chlamydiales bacterium]
MFKRDFDGNCHPRELGRPLALKSYVVSPWLPLLKGLGSTNRPLLEDPSKPTNLDGG